MSYPIPVSEEKRLEELHQLGILDTLAEEAYDNITKLAASIFNAPIAFISLVDKDRQWFKSKIGVDLDETPRDIAFCAYNIMDEAPLIVEDATKDERFKDNPLVLEDPAIRFYAGSPLKSSDNHLLGSLCIIDKKPRKLTDHDVELLEILSKQVSVLFDLRKTSIELKTSLVENQKLHELLPMCSWCNKVRDDKDYWFRVEEYIETLSSSKITHSICPDCSKKLDEDLEFV